MKNTTPKRSRPKKPAVSKLLTALDRLILAAKHLEQARDELIAKAENPPARCRPDTQRSNTPYRPCQESEGG